MSRSMNKVYLLGHLGKDAEQRFTQSGTAVASFSMATSRGYKKGEQWEEATDWHEVVLWKSENLINYLTKGKQVMVEGRLQTRSWEGQDGKKHFRTEVVCENLILLGGQQAPQQQAPQQQRTQPPQAQPQQSPYDQTYITDDDVPF